ncbi:hypothetical protein TELCIR_03541 [Teladorsagia circumcincta]|uniref:Helitron helicase-like domain-containing protein n=1 Tax=Teladorsagia circumcincta TaxID=45464 RepID=A0A2G9UW29_TELCI|nr:hypothetical protein TELCIR_03541 [Teladorsagia circumcincta]
MHDTETMPVATSECVNEKAGKKGVAVLQRGNERGLRRHQYNLPTVDEVAVVYVGEDNDVPPARSLVVHLRKDTGEQLQGISDIDKISDPLTYPLLFPTGEGGWEPSMSNDEGFRTSQREYHSYLLSVRNSFNPIFYGGKLFQQFAVDPYAKIEQNRLNFAKKRKKPSLVVVGKREYDLEGGLGGCTVFCLELGDTASEFYY